MGSGCASGGVPPGQPEEKPNCGNCGNECVLKNLPCYARSEKHCTTCENVISGSEWRWVCRFGCNTNICLACGRRGAAVKGLTDAVAADQVGVLKLAIEEAKSAGVADDDDSLKQADAALTALLEKEARRKAAALTVLQNLANSGLVDQMREAIQEGEAAGLADDELAASRDSLKQWEKREEALKKLSDVLPRSNPDELQAVLRLYAGVLNDDDVLEAKSVLADMQTRQKEARQAISEAMTADDEAAMSAAIEEGVAAKLPGIELQAARNALKRRKEVREATDLLKAAISETGEVFGGLEEAISRAERAGVPPEELDVAKAGQLALQNLKQEARQHKNGIVVFVGSEAQLKYYASFCALGTKRAMLQCANPSVAKELLNDFSDGCVVCLVCSKEMGEEMGEYLRHNDGIIPQLRSVPLIWVTSDHSLRAKAGALGLIMEGDVKKLAARVLSLPTLGAIRSEARAGSFQGNTTDVRFGHFKDKGLDIKFTDNEQMLLASIQRSRLSWYPEVEGYDEHIGRLEAYFQAMQPVHRCKPATFLAILREGGLMSREELERLLGSSQSAILRTARHVRLQELAAQPRFAKSQRWIFKYAEAACELKIATSESATKKAREKLESSRPRDLGPAELSELEAVVQDVVKDVLAQRGAKIGGIGYDKDKILGTTRHVFATLGPNAGFHYGSVVIVLSRNLMYHPGFWCSPLAATGFVGPHFWVFRHRPWGSAALLDLAVGSGSEEVKDLEGAPETPEADSEGVDACLKSALNMAAMNNWPRIMAREVDAMCHYLVSEQRTPYTFDMPYTTAKCKQAYSRILKGSTLQDDAWQEVRQYYETKDSHTLYECHLPGFVPLGAITKVIVSDKLYNEHTDIKQKVDTFVMPDGRKLRDMMVITKTKEECMEWQHSYFDELRKECLTGRLPHRPISVYMAGRAGRPAFLPPDFASWYSSGGDDSDGSLCISFACRATHDIRVAFASDPHAQRKDVKLDDERLRRTTYCFCLGYSFNTISYITRGVLGNSGSLKYFKDDKWARCAACGTSAEATTVWERYWFQVKMESGHNLLRCGRGPMGENVLMEARDQSPIRNLQYIGLACYNQPTVFCDLKVE